ncbi:hypothetical protein Zmor_021540 [Zophobas morio]|uniref:UTP--glucose-1-phosphate uridylyltransferase n=1 Tax=Zophobas morio TaxID=2755281 RepID=A0AA38MAK7_9CUCU|nr:hypothetical protein Zmor_021540 [Zophobas morio]
MLVKLFKLGEDEVITTFTQGSHVLGRGTSLQCNDKRISRNHATIEVTPDNITLTSIHGGTLIQYQNKLRLLEIAQVPKEHVDDFKSVKTFKFFNTNNLWAKLDAIERVLTEGSLSLEIIINNKTLNNGLNVIQLETACVVVLLNYTDSL